MHLFILSVVSKCVHSKMMMGGGGGGSSDSGMEVMVMGSDGKMMR